MGMPTDKPRITSQNSETSIGDDIIAGSPDELGDSAQNIVMRFDDNHSLDIMIADDRWAPYFDEALHADIGQLVIFTSALIEGDGFTACLRWTNNDEMQALNAQFRDKDKATNVLSFPNYVSGDFPNEDDSGLFLGDVAFGFETMKTEAEEMGIPIGAHMRHLIIHGLLHLIGCDHEDEDDATEMEGLEIAALSVIGVTNPYQEAVVS